MSWNKLNPALFKAAVTAVFALLAGTGVAWATEERAFLISAAVAAVLALLQGVSTRESVTPNAKVLAFLGKPGTRNPIIYAGEATVPESRSGEVAEAAVRGAA